MSGCWGETIFWSISLKLFVFVDVTLFIAIGLELVFENGKTPSYFGIWTGELGINGETVGFILCVIEMKLEKRMHSINYLQLIWI